MKDIYLTLLFLLMSITYGVDAEEQDHRDQFVLHWYDEQTLSIAAESEQEALMGLGWAMAYERGEGLLEHYQALRDEDEQLEVLNLQESAANYSQEPSLAEDLGAFAKGINFFFSFRLDTLSPEVRGVYPVTAQDVMALALYQRFMLDKMQPRKNQMDVDSLRIAWQVADEAVEVWTDYSGSRQLIEMKLNEVSVPAESVDASPQTNSSEG